MNGGDDGARTRDLCRDSSVLRLFNDLQTRGERLRPPKSWKTVHFVDRIVDRESNYESDRSVSPRLLEENSDRRC